MKLTNKKTVIVFPKLEDKKEAENFLLKMNIPFQGIVRKPVFISCPFPLFQKVFRPLFASTYCRLNL